MAPAAEVLPRNFGPYTLLKHLGEGGMAEVLLARQEGIEGTQRQVALKRILPGLARDEDNLDHALKWAFDEENSEARDDLGTDPEAQPEGPKNSASPIEPAQKGNQEAWSPKQHWEHLPPWLRSPPFLSLVAIVHIVFFIFAILGARSWL